MTGAISKQSFIEDLRRVDKETSGVITVADYRNSGKYSTTSARRIFGSWNKAKERAGLETIERGENENPNPSPDGLNKEKRRRRLRAIKEHTACGLCGEDRVSAAMDFHHVDPIQKKMGLSRMVEHGYSWQDISNEMRKCMILCASCHREVEAGERVI